MRRLESMEDDMRGVVTYEFGGGQRLTVDARAVRELGIAAVLRGTEYERFLPTERVTLYQEGKQIGTVPPTFDPIGLKPNPNYPLAGLLVDYRPGDFKLIDGAWHANKMLGPGDIEAIPGFVRER